MKKTLINLTLALATSGCCTRHAAMQKLGIYALTDTIAIHDTTFVPVARIDTLLQLKPADPVVIEKERVRYELRVDSIKGETVYVQVSGECKPDTIVKEKKVAAPIKFIEKPLGFWDKALWALWLALAIAVILAIIIFLAKK